jgi:hypothetical protein
MNCPYCGNKTECDMVDVGVGNVQCGPYHCEHCLSVQMSPDEDRTNATEEERTNGWWVGEMRQLKVADQ